MVSKTLWYHGESKVVQAFCPGAVCKIDGTVPGSEEEATWQQGVAFIEYDDYGHNIDFVGINNGSAYYRGKHFLWEDYRNKLYELDYFKNLPKDLLED